MKYHYSQLYKLPAYLILLGLSFTKSTLLLTIIAFLSIVICVENVCDGSFKIYKLPAYVLSHLVFAIYSVAIFAKLR